MIVSGWVPTITRFRIDLPLLNIMLTAVKWDVFERSPAWMVVTVYFDEALLGHMGIDLRRGDIHMTQHHLNDP